MSSRFFRASALALLALTIPAGISQASTNSPRVDVSLQGNVVQSISVVVAVPTVLFGVVTNGTTNAAPAGQALAITSVWNLGVGQTVKLYAYFDTAASAMTGTVVGDPIPVSAFTASVNGGAQQSFNASSPFTTGSTATVVYSVAVVAANEIATRSDSLALAMNLTGMSLHSDVYTGVMHLQAQAL